MSYKTALKQSNCARGQNSLLNTVEIRPERNDWDSCLCLRYGIDLFWNIWIWGQAVLTGHHCCLLNTSYDRGFLCWILRERLFRVWLEMLVRFMDGDVCAVVSDVIICIHGVYMLSSCHILTIRRSQWLEVFCYDRFSLDMLTLDDMKIGTLKCKHVS